MVSLIREQTISTVDERRLKREVDATLKQGNQTRARRAAQETGSALPGPGQPEQSCLVLLELGSSPLCVRMSFCREFNVCDAPGTRANRGGGFLRIYKRDHFVESVDGRGFLPGNRNRWVAFDKSRRALNGIIGLT